MLSLFVFSLLFILALPAPFPDPFFYILPTFCWPLTAKPNWHLLQVLGPLYRSTPMSQEPELRSTCGCFMMQEGNRAYPSLCHLPLFCFLGRSRSAMLCQPVWLPAAQKSLVCHPRSPRQLKDLPRALSVGRCLCTLSFQTAIQSCSLKCHSEMFYDCRWKGGGGLCQLLGCSERLFCQLWDSLVLSRDAGPYSSYLTTGKNVQQCRAALLVTFLLGLLRRFWNSSEPPHPVFCGVLKKNSHAETENQSQHEPQPLSYQLSVTVNEKQIQIFAPSETAAANAVLLFHKLLVFLSLQTCSTSSAKVIFKISCTSIGRKVCVSAHSRVPSPLHNKMEESLVQGSLHSSELQEL